MKYLMKYFVIPVFFSFLTYANTERAPRPPFPIPSQEAQDQEQLFPQHESNIFEGTITVEGNIIIQNNNNDENMYCLIFQKSRLGGKVQNNDEIGCIEFEGHDGFQNGAAIRSHIDGTPSTGIVPGRIEFYTEPTTQGTAFERMRITGTGFIGVGTQSPFAELQLDNTSFGFSLQERSLTPAGVGPFINLGSFVSGKYAYLIGTGSRLAIFDISNPNNPVALGSVATAGSPLQVFVLNNLAYVGTSSGNFQIFDVSNPNISPVLLSTTIIFDVTWLFVRGTLAYIINDTTLSIYDVSNPNLPVSLGVIPITANAVSVFVENNYAYIINTGTPSDLQIYDISNPALITLISSTTIPATTQPNALFVKGNTTYIVTEDGLFFIYDVTNPTSPTLLSTTTLTDHGRQINVYDNYAYVSMPTDGVSVFDVSSPATPVNVYNNMNFFPLMVSGNFVYARDMIGSNLIIANGPISLYAHKNASLLGNVEVNSVFNVARGLLYTDGTTNQVGINTPFPGAALDVNGDARISQDLLVTNNVNIFGPVAINNNNAIPYDILKNSSIAAPAGIISPGSFVSSNYAYVVGPTSTFAIFDISNPNNPVAKQNIGGVGTSVFVQNSIAYAISNASNELQIFDVSNPNAVTVINFGIAITSPTWIFVRGFYAYITTSISSSALLIYDISNPITPLLVSTTSISGFTANRVFVENNIAYVSNSTASPDNLQAWNVADPSSPVFLGAVTTGFAIDAIFVKNGLVYLVETTSPGNFNIYDFTSPTTPSLVSSTLLINTPRNVIVYDNYAYISMATNGLSIYDVTIPATPTLVINSSLIFPFFVSGNYIYGSNSSTGTNFVIASGPIALNSNPNSVLLGNVEIGTMLNVARGNLFVDGTTNQVGINTPFPGSTLDVNGDIAVDGDLIINDNASITGNLFVSNNEFVGQNIDFNVLSQPLSVVGSLQPGTIRIAYGIIDSHGGIFIGSGDFSVNHTGTGSYDINFSFPPFVTSPFVSFVAAPLGGQTTYNYIQVVGISNSQISININTFMCAAGGGCCGFTSILTPLDIGFSFLAIGQYIT